MRDNLREYERKRDIAKKDKLENKKAVVEGKQKTIMKDGKKIIIPCKVTYEEDKQPNKMAEEQISPEPQSK